MGYYSGEVLHELKLGESYTQRQLRIFVINHINTSIVLSRSCKLFEMESELVHKVLEVFEAYEHRGMRHNNYTIPNNKFTVYIVE